MAQHYAAFSWDVDWGGKAYEYTKAALMRKLHHLWAQQY